MKSWLAALGVYRDRRMLAILCMGFSSGLPYALTGSTLSIWLRTEGVSLTDIGLFSLVGLAYILKFLWSPVLDRVALPLLTPRLGRRRSWALFIQVLLALAILGLGFTNPRAAREWVAIVAVLVAFFSASQDIVIDAYRVELLATDEQGAGAAATQIGYRIGIIASTAGALYLSVLGWRAAYGVMAASMLVGLVTVLMTREPPEAPRPRGDWFQASVIEPFLDFTRHRSWLVILVFVVLFKLGDAIAISMAGPLYVTLGFSNAEIASITKVFGMAAAMAGVSLGGLLVARAGVMCALLIGGVLQMLSILLYIVQYRAGHDPVVLAVTIAAENVTGGIGSAAFVAYLSGLCNLAFTATQYALLSALASVARIVLASSGGWMADQFGWTEFFLIATAACLPALGLLLWLARQGGLAPPPRSPALAA